MIRVSTSQLDSHHTGNITDQTSNFLCKTFPNVIGIETRPLLIRPLLGARWVNGFSKHFFSNLEQYFSLKSIYLIKRTQYRSIHTFNTVPSLGSIILTFLSLHDTTTRDPSRLKEALSAKALSPNSTELRASPVPASHRMIRPSAPVQRKDNIM